MGFLVNLYILDRAFPEGLFMAFIQLKVQFLPVATKSPNDVPVVFQRDEPYIFSSLIKCPWCGNNYTGYRKKQKLKNGRSVMRPF